MKDKFIRFLKDAHAFDEYKKEILPYDLNDLRAQFDDGGAKFLLGDGCIFYWTLAKTDVDWEVLNDEWVAFLAVKNKDESSTQSSTH